MMLIHSCSSFIDSLMARYQLNKKDKYGNSMCLNSIIFQLLINYGPLVVHNLIKLIGIFVYFINRNVF